MAGIIKAFDGLPKWAKIVLALPFLDIAWVIYRMCRSIQKKNTLGIVLSVLMIIFGVFFLWLIDIITIVVKGKVLWLD